MSMMSEVYPEYYKDVSHLEEIDVYGVCELFEVDDKSGCLPHAIKKLLLAGVRTGRKLAIEDIKEARDTLNRKIEMVEKANEVFAKYNLTIPIHSAGPKWDGITDDTDAVQSLTDKSVVEPELPPVPEGFVPWVKWDGGECPIPWAKGGEYALARVDGNSFVSDRIQASVHGWGIPFDDCSITHYSIKESFPPERMKEFVGEDVMWRQVQSEDWSGPNVLVQQASDPFTGDEYMVARNRQEKWIVSHVRPLTHLEVEAADAAIREVG